MSQEELLRTLSHQLDTLTRLVAVSVGEGKNLREQILILSRAGLEPKVIAEILGTTANAVSVTRYQTKSSKRKARP